MDYAAEAKNGFQDIKFAFPDLEDLQHHPSSPWIVCKIQSHQIMITPTATGRWTYALDGEQPTWVCGDPVDAMRGALEQLRDKLWKAGDYIEKLLYAEAN